MMIRAAQALRDVMTLPEWDGKPLISRGGSQGAVQAIQGASMVDEVTLMDTWVPWLCDICSGDIGRICGFGNFSGNAMRFFDLSLRAKYVTKKVIISAGLGDATTRASGITAMYHKLAGEKELSFTQSREHIYVSPEAESFKVEA
jgi:cephalosporin-C deacetylase-like acetyl esterase